MRPLFHFPFPCTQPPSQQPSPTATVPLQPEMSHRPHPAPVRHRRRSPALLSAVRPLPALIAPHHLSTAPLLPAPIGLASSTSRPPRAAARVPLSRCVGPGALAGKNRTACIPFSPNARKRPPSWQHPPEMHAFRDQDGNIFALCIHFRAQSGDSGYMARESCRQGPFFASRSPKSRMARRCCQRRPAFPRQRLAVRRNGLCALRQRHAARGMAERALRPAAQAWPAAACAPCHLARVHRRRLTRVVLRRPHRVYRAQPSAAPPIAVGASRRSGSSCCPRAAHAVPTGPRPRANRVPPTRGAVCAHPRPATRRASPCRAGPAAVPAIPVKWCGDTIAHTRKLRF